MQITIRDPGSAITHFIGMMLSIFGTIPLIALTADATGLSGTISIIVFVLSMILLYAASSLYHSVNFSGKKLKIFKKIDHMMIFVLIAGTYTPICVISLKGTLGYTLLGIIWGIAAIGIFLKFFWVTCPKWVSSTIYIAMGWVCVFIFKPLWHTLSRPAFFWLLAGGIIYTIGGIIYALKLSIFNAKHKYFGSHEIFHLFVMGGSFCHVITMYLLF